MDKPSPALSKGEQFLQDKKKDGVITLRRAPEGFSEGSGLKRPLVDTPCDCHYLGTLIDGTQFDSSFDRGKPSAFAPNQVIKGWTSHAAHGRGERGVSFLILGVRRAQQAAKILRRP